MSGKRALILYLLPTLSVALPRFEVHWESEKGYEDVDPLVSPWHIRLGLLKQTLSIPIQTSPRSGDIDVGPPGYLGGPSVVTIDSADYCVDSCQESWPDEFCSKYPPEGVPTAQQTKSCRGLGHQVQHLSKHRGRGHQVDPRERRSGGLVLRRSTLCPGH